jgi:hypothetical protein
MRKGDRQPLSYRLKFVEVANAGQRAGMCFRVDDNPPVAVNYLYGLHGSGFIKGAASFDG